MSWQRKPIQIINVEIARTHFILFSEAFPLGFPELPPPNVMDYCNGLVFAAGLLTNTFAQMGGPKDFLFRDTVRNVFSSLRETATTALGWNNRSRWFQEGFEKMIDQAQKAVLGE